MGLTTGNGCRAAQQVRQDASAQPRLSIVIPAFNEQNRLPETLATIIRFVAHTPQWMPVEVVVVDDGSSDRTAEAARCVDCVSGVTVEVHAHPQNRGKGAAARTGFAATRGSLVLLTDADLSAPIDGLAALVEAAEAGAIAVGSRAVDRSLITRPQPWYRDIMGRTFNLTVRALGLCSAGDTQCGFKLYPGRLARRLAAVQQLDGFAFDVEHLVLARAWGFPVVEIGVEWRHVEASRVLAVRHSAQMLRDLARLWWRRTSGGLPAPPEDVT